MKKFLMHLLASFVFFSCTNSKSQDPVPLHETFKIFAKNVGEERVINVWLPENYKNSQEKFPVLYMADGGIEEDFPHIANTLSKLIKENKIPPIILVGIENTDRKRDLTGFTNVASDKKLIPGFGGSQKFRTFIKTELFPEINKRFRTSAKKGIIGESLSGLFVAETLFQNPEMFDFYIAFDPSLWWNDRYLVTTAKENLAKFPSKETKFWFAGSSARDISKHTQKLAKTLQEVKSPNMIWTYSDEPKEKHNTIFRATKEKALVWTLGN